MEKQNGSGRSLWRWKTDMALRIRKDGRILCAAMHPEIPGDTYLDDGLHYSLSVDHRVLVTEPWDAHSKRGEWWWRGNVPEGVTIEDFYK
jgi:hypothetical protein